MRVHSYVAIADSSEPPKEGGLYTNHNDQRQVRVVSPNCCVCFFFFFQVSMLHVTQLDRIVDVVEEASRGRVVTLLEKILGASKYTPSKRLEIQPKHEEPKMVC